MDVAILHEEFVEGSALGHQVEMIMIMTMRMIMRMTMKMMTLIMRLTMVDDDLEGENEFNDHEDINYHYDLEGDHNEVALG